MRVKSALDFFEWELVKIGRFFLKLSDDLLWKPKRSISIDQLINSYGHKESFFFIQVGANDGVTGDHLHNYIKKNKWHGILMEPVPYIFEKLKENYRTQPNLIFENSAIGKENGLVPFYSISEYNSEGVKHDQFANGLAQLGSFDKKTLLQHSAMHPEFKNFIKEIKVPTITLNDLFLKYSVTNLDLLLIDTEGYDFEILNNTNFEKIKPAILIFEHQHISRNDYKILIRKLKSYGYKFFVNRWDTFSVLNKTNLGQ